MFRRTMIILISVLAMVFLALLLHRLPQLNYERVVGLFKVEPKDVDKGSSGSMEVGEQGTSLAESDFEIIVRDPDTNRLRYVIRARKMAPEVGTTRTHLTEPDFYIYNNDGEIVNVKAPNGYFDTTGGPLDEYDDITRGRLTGGVVLRQDRGTPNDPGDDIVITMEHMDYARVATLDSLDDEGGEAMPADETPVSKLSTGDPVQVRSPEGDVDAVGMIVYLVRGKSDLRQLRLLTEVHIVLRTGSDKFQMGLVGDGSATGEPAESAGAATEAKSAAATSQTASGTAARPASGAATPSSGTGAAKRTGGQASGSTAGQGSGSGAAPVGAAAKGDASAGQPVDQNLMHFLMLKNVRINQGDRRLVGDRVTLLMPEESDSDKSSDSSRTTAPQTPPPTGSPGTTAPSATNGSRPAARTPSATTAPPARNGGGRPSAAPTTPSPGPSGDDASQEGDAAAVPVDIVCDGPFVLTPRQVREPPVKFHVTAAGSPVVLTDKDMEARGEYFQYDGTSKQGKLRGGAKQEATVIQNQSTVTGELFTFDQTAGTARVDGRGHLVGKASGGGLGLGGGASDEKNEEPFRARWDDWMSVSYMARDVTVDGETRNKSFLRVADFSGKAVLWQGEQTLAGDRIHAEFFLPTADGTQGLLRLTADGQVAARQPESKDSMALGDLACEHLDADFVRLPGGDSRIAAMHAKGQVRGAGRDKDLKAGDIEAEELWVTFMEDPKNPKALKAETMKAETDVRVRREGYYAESDYLEMKDGGERIELRGAGERLALVSSGTNKLRGKTIVAQQSANRADVTGQGSLNLLSNRGVEGEKLKEPMPLHITWSESMFFDGKANQAHFMGDAKARTPSASIDCRDLWVFFSDRPEADKKATDDGDDASKLFGTKDLLRLTAVEDVVARAVNTPDDPTEGLSVTTIESDKLEYNAEKDMAFVPGAGVLTVIEVDRVPAVQPPHERKARNSTRVTWKREMIFERQRGVAYFGEDVVARVVGRSKGLIDEKKEGMGKLSGTSTLWCQDLRLFLTQSDAAKEAEEGSGSRTELKQLVAADRVFFKDGDYHARGARMSYDKPQELLVLTRSQAQPAAIWVQNEQKQIFDRWGGDKLYYYRFTREVKVLGPREITVTPRDQKMFE